MLALPPTLDYAPEFCFCGRKTVESHEFWFCSTECARLDSLRSLGNSECHYRNVVRDVYVRASASRFQPRRMVSAVHLRSSPTEQHGPADVPAPFIPPTNLPQPDNAIFKHDAGHNWNMIRSPTLSQVAGKVLTKKAAAGEPLVAEGHDRPRLEGFPTTSSRFQVSLNATPSAGYVPVHPLRPIPFSINGLKNNSGKPSVATLLKLGQSRKAKEGRKSERIFGHDANIIVPPVRKESLPSYREMASPSVVPVETLKALHRSASFSGWNATACSGPSDNQDPLMHIIEEMREELSESLDPKSLFNSEEHY